MNCEICKKECNGFLGLSTHIVQGHKIFTKDYYDDYLRKKDNNEGICPTCGKETHFSGLGNGYCKFCSVTCCSSNAETKKKKIETNLIKTGIDNPFRNVKNIKNSMLKKHGCEHALQIKEFVEKSKNTCITNLGYDNPSKSPVVKELKIETNQKNRGVDNPSQSSEIKELKKETSIENCGRDHFMKTEEGKEKVKQGCIKSFGIDSWAKTDEGKLFHRDQSIKQREKQYNHGEPLCPFISDSERSSLDALQSYLPIYNIKRNPRVINFFPDGWIEELKLDNEYDENDHKYQLEEDKNRDRQFYNVGCYVFRIKESEWLADQQEVIDKFLYLVNYLEQVKKLKEILL